MQDSDLAGCYHYSSSPGMVEENADLIYNRVNKNPKFISKQEFWQTVTNMINENCHFAAQRDVKVGICLGNIESELLTMQRLEQLHYQGYVDGYAFEYLSLTESTSRFFLNLISSA